MGNYKEDTNQNFRTIFLIILFSLFVLASSNNPGSHTSSSAKYPSQNELVFGDISSQRNAIICNAVNLPNLQKYCECALPNTSLDPFSIQNKISDYNRGITQNFILVRKTRLSIEPVLSWRLYFYLPSIEDDNLPVLG
ncbi:MAG: hypothetical protein MUO72_18835 [Bacteroidales bacterium]|nr:hypothetical protein [Bacteroidales bacterium]